MKACAPYDITFHSNIVTAYLLYMLPTQAGFCHFVHAASGSSAAPAEQTRY